MHRDNIQQLRKQSLLGEPYDSEPNLMDPEDREAFLYDPELTAKAYSELFDDEDNQSPTGT